MNHVTRKLCLAGILSTLAFAALADKKPVPVGVNNFIRAETDTYFGKAVQQGAFGKLDHNRQMAPIHEQTVVRMNRDTLYSSGVFDLDAAPVTITLPDPGKRFMSLMVLSEDHYAIAVVYPRAGSPTPRTKSARTTLCSPSARSPIRQTPPTQGRERPPGRDQGRAGEPPAHSSSRRGTRNPRRRRAMRSTVLGSTAAAAPVPCSVRKYEVDPVVHLIGTAVGWGGNPRKAAIYQGGIPRPTTADRPHAHDARTFQWTVLVDQRLQRPGLLREKRPRRVLDEQSHGETERRWLVHRAVRRLPAATPELPSDHAGLELHGSPLSSAPGNHRRQVAVAAAASGAVSTRSRSHGRRSRPSRAHDGNRSVQSRARIRSNALNIAIHSHRALRQACTSLAFKRRCDGAQALSQAERCRSLSGMARCSAGSIRSPSHSSATRSAGCRQLR